MNALTKLKKILQENSNGFENVAYYVPKAWNYFNHVSLSKGEYYEQVNPYAFYADAITYIEDHPATRETDLNRAYMYSTMIRASTSFDHNLSGTLEITNPDGFKESGTFVKMIAYLPTLRKLGINTIYMLPIMQASKYEKKGDMGSAYGVVDFFQLESDLFDPITKDKMTIDEQFSAFVEAAHHFGMNVVMDIIPKTNSVNTQFVIDHPEWFYWIECKDLDKYASPHVPGIAPVTPINEKNIKTVYESEAVHEYISLFRFAPNILFPKEWEAFVEAFKANPTSEILPSIEERFKMRIAPAFSDVINDVQAPWSDVTFFRMYMDAPAILKEKGIVSSDVPYILFDTIKSNLFPGKQENTELWNTITSILPYYIKKFNIDGARIDMGHALPEKLSKQIITKAKQVKPDFYFIAEILGRDVKAMMHAKEIGYDMIIGDGFYHTHRFEKQLTRNFYYESATLPMPLFALGETHDNPRLISRTGGFKTLRFVSILNLFAYNCLPFMNSGQELLEPQPMNLGVDCPKDSDLVLAKDDPYYKKLALFDLYQFHYDRTSPEFIELLGKIANIRKNNLDLILDMKAMSYIYYPEKDKIAFVYENEHKKLYILANASMSTTHTFDIFADGYEILYASGDGSFTLQPLDILILEER